MTKELQSLEANRNKLIEQTRKEMETELQTGARPLREALARPQKAERMTVFERAQAIEKVEEEVAQADEGLQRVQKRERKPRRGPLPLIEPGDRVYLTRRADAGRGADRRRTRAASSTWRWARCGRGST